MSGYKVVISAITFDGSVLEASFRTNDRDEAFSRANFCLEHGAKFLGSVTEDGSPKQIMYMFPAEQIVSVSVVGTNLTVDLDNTNVFEVKKVYSIE